MLGRDDDGYFESTLERSSTDTVAITTEDIMLDADPDPALFIGIGPRDDVLTYLDGVAYDEIFVVPLTIVLTADSHPIVHG